MAEFAENPLETEGPLFPGVDVDGVGLEVAERV